MVSFQISTLDEFFPPQYSADGFFLAEMRQTTAKHTGPLTYWGG